jgi:hypothetical protein
MNYSKFNEVYKSLLEEEVNSINKHQIDKNDQDKKDSESHIDELTEENITTIEEDTEGMEETQENPADPTVESTDDEPAEENDGWDESVEELCSELTYQFDGFAYEIKNCVKGSFTDANTPDELANYLEKLKYEIDNVIDQLRTM